MASQLTSLTIVYSTVYSGADQIIKHQSFLSLAFVQGIHRWPVNSPHKWPVKRKMFPFDDVIMIDVIQTSFAKNGRLPGVLPYDLVSLLVLAISLWKDSGPWWRHDTLQWRHNGRDGDSTHQSHESLLNRLFRRKSQKTSKLHVTGLCAGNSPVTGEFPAQMASNAENVSIWWRHHDVSLFRITGPLWGDSTSDRWIMLTKRQSHSMRSFDVWCS